MRIEIKVLWCKGIAAFNFFQKLTPYIVVKIHTIDERLELSQSQKQEQKTHVDNDGDGNPEWHYTMYFDLDDTMLSNLRQYLLLFEIKNHGQILMDRNIGDVKVPLHDLIQSVGYGVVRFASYEVTSFDGKSNGVLDFSYKVMADHFVDHDYVGQSGPLDLDRVDYSRVQIDGYGGNGVPSAPPLLGGGEENNGGYYQGHSPSYYPPRGPAMWTPPPLPPRPQPVAYRPPPEEYYNQQHSGSSESCYGYLGCSPGPPQEEYCYNQQHSCYGYHGYSYRPPPPPAPASGTGKHYYYQHSNSVCGDGYGYHHW